MRYLIILLMLVLVIGCSQTPKPLPEYFKPVRQYLEKYKCELCPQGFPWQIIEVKHEYITKYIPDCNIFIADWICCQDKPKLSYILALSKHDNQVVHFKEYMQGKYFKPVKDEQSALEIAGLILSLDLGADFGGELLLPISKKSVIEKIDDCFVVSRLNEIIIDSDRVKYKVDFILEFDKDGTVKTIKRDRIRVW